MATFMASVYMGRGIQGKQQSVIGASLYFLLKNCETILRRE
jgi:hypothetical protein